MNLRLFNVATTNLFPATNTTTGGQLVTEYNLRSRESVEGPESIEYMQGLTCVHSEQDFALFTPAGSISYFPGATSGGTVLYINSGRAVINGFYVENTVPMVVDMAAINQELVDSGGTALSGKLAVGLRIMFSTEETMSGSVLVEDSQGQYFDGIQVVILPVSQFYTPLSKGINGSTEYDCGKPAYRSMVTADILLGTFNYINGNISDVFNNYPGKCQMIPASRISDIDTLISSTYVDKTGLNPKKLYTFAGKGTDPETGASTWCDSTDALMVWDNAPQLTTEQPSEQEVQFRTVNGNKVQLAIPHKQVDGMLDGQGNPQYYATKYLNLPAADWGTSRPGIVTSDYTKAVKAVSQQLTQFYQLTNGKQRGFVDTLKDRKDLPFLNTNWDVGDYVLVAKDSTVLNTLNDTLQLTPPSTVYVVLPGIVTSINAPIANEQYEPIGTRLDIYYYNRDENPLDLTNPARKMDWWDLSSGKYRGIVDEDYFELVLTDNFGQALSRYYTVKTTDNIRTYSDPIQLTGQYPFATENLTGGFLNVPSTYVDGGYVYLDDYGHLRLMDYALLRSGTLAYQLGADYTVEAGLTLDEVQALISEYINERIAFPTLEQAATSDPNVITVTVNLPSDSADEPGTLNISGIDSRFNTAVNIMIYGKATSATTINISDCEKIKVTLVEGTPKINVHRCCLYYDVNLINILNTITDMTLWYEKMADTDPNLVVEGMTVRVVTDPSAYSNSQVNYNVVSSEFWTPTNANDNHIMVALQSVTFGSNGAVTGCGVLVRNDSTSNILEGRQVFYDNFILPQGPELFYPPYRLYQPVRVTGHFISAYTLESPQGYAIQETDFSLSTQYLLSDNVTFAGGQIAFLTNSYTMAVPDPVSLDVWDTSVFHYFEGTTSL